LFFASFLMILLREELLKEKEIITKDEIYQKFKIYINKDEKKLRSNIDSAINTLVKLTFLKEMEKDVFRIRNSVESFCNVKFLDDINKKLDEYIQKLKSEY